MKLRLLWLALLLLHVGVAWAAEDQYFDSDGVSIRYQVLGSGTPLILVHGFTASFEVNWDGAKDLLAAHYQVIGLDLRGHGKSGKPHDAESYGVQMVEDITRLMDHLGIGQAHVAGYSLGSIVALKMAVLHPDRLYSIVLGGNGLFTAEELAAIGAKHKATLEALAAQGIEPVDLRFPPGSEVPENIQPIVTRMREIKTDPLALSAAVGTLDQLAVSTEEAAAIQLPVLVIHGSLDDPLKTSERLKAAQPATEIVVLDQQDHLSAPYAPEFGQALLQFLQKIRP
jgi:pimeloyl-ACP methyl ester carboxylesterase